MPPHWEPVLKGIPARAKSISTDTKLWSRMCNGALFIIAKNLNGSKYQMVER